MLCTCKSGTTSDVEIFTDPRVNVSWMKQFIIEYLQDIVLYGFDSPGFTFSIYHHKLDNNDILLLVPGKIMIYNG